MNRGYSRTKLVSYIVNSLNEGKSEKALSRHVAAYLIDCGKMNDLESVMRDAQELRATDFGVIELKAKSSHELDINVKKQINDIAKHHYPKSKQVIINEENDESTVGGVNVLLPHHSLDITIRNKLNQLRKAVS